MHPFSFIFILFLFLLSLNPSFSALLQNDTVSCPLNFTILTTLAQRSTLPTTVNTTLRCQYLRLGLRILLSDYLRRTSSFLPPPNASAPCFNAYQSSFHNFIGDFDIQSNCRIQANWISQGCLNDTTRSQFEASVPRDTLEKVYGACNQSLQGTSACGACITSIVNMQATSVRGDCAAYATIYAAAVVNPYGPEDLDTAKCLFKIDLSNSEESNNGKSNNRRNIIVISVSVVVSVVLLGVILFGVSCLYRRRLGGRNKFGKTGSSLAFSGLDSVGENASLKEFSIEEVKAATKNFARENVIGSGGYGNVYRGVLKDGTEVALKRFKNLSAAGSDSFKHELEIIASVRHVNLVGLIGYCTWTTELEGHQRIIVCELMKNGSLYDHLFGSNGGKLSWPVRRKIALGTAQGLAYLHNGVQPAIIHRDVKSNNILLDETFEPKVADFGLAKFTPDGFTHMSTRVSGTMGYVAPEYALFGRLTERTDVYSFGVVLLELLTGKKALMASNDGQVTLLGDWVWSLVKEGRALDIVEDMQDVDPPELIEKYVKIAVLCSHTQLYARPTMTEVVKLLDNDIPVPPIPDRPDPVMANINELDKSASIPSSDPPG